MRFMFLFEENLIYDICYVKPKGPAEKFNKKCGPLQKCNIGFFTADENIVQIKQVLDKYELKMMVILISTSLMLVCN